MTSHPSNDYSCNIEFPPCRNCQGDATRMSLIHGYAVCERCFAELKTRAKAHFIRLSEFLCKLPPSVRNHLDTE